MAQVDILTTKQAANLFYVVQWSIRNGCLIPLPAELAELINASESEAAGQIAELRQLGLFIARHSASSFHTKAAAMHKSEAAVIIAASAACQEWERPWVTKEEIINAVHRHYQEAGEWKIGDLLEAAVRMEYLISHGNGTYECAPKIARHLPYLKFLLRPPRPSPQRRLS